MGNRTPHTRALQRPSQDSFDRETFTRVLELSTAMLSSALSDNTSLDDVFEGALKLFHHVAHSDVEVLCVRLGQEWKGRAYGLDGDDSLHCGGAGRGTSFHLGSLDHVRLSDIPVDRGLHALSPEEAERYLTREIASRDRAWCYLPLGNDGKLIGVIFFARSQSDDFTDEERFLLGACAARAVTAFVFRTQREQLERAVRARDQALLVVAHDLRNPLNVISLAANTLLQRFAETSARSPIERIIRSAHRADRMIRDLLEINAIETGRLSLDKHLQEPADVILAALDSQQALAAEASVIIATDISPELPLIDVDEERLHRVLENLIGNAIKFTGAGGQITVGANVRDNELVVRVQDSGIGIAPEHLPHIFDRFYQASRAERHGTGLGLTISKGIVEAHNGNIWAESVPGEGTTMYFTLPTVPAESKKEPPLRRANILIVDDRPENLVALEAILERPEYRLLKATSGEDALSMALREQFAVALIDVAMPGMNGLDVAVNLKALERSRDIPIIFITAFGNDPEEIHRAYTAGGADYLVKPLDAEIVRKKVAVFVELSRRRSGTERARALS